MLNWGHHAALSPLVWSTTTVLNFGQHYARLWRLMPTVLDRGRSAELLPLLRSITAVFNSGQHAALSPILTVPFNWAVPKLFWINARSVLRYCACTHQKTSNYFLGGKGGEGLDEHKKPLRQKPGCHQQARKKFQRSYPRYSVSQFQASEGCYGKDLPLFQLFSRGRWSRPSILTQRYDPVHPDISNCSFWSN